MTNFTRLGIFAALTLSLAIAAFATVAPVLAAPTDPYNIYAPGIQSSTSDVPAKKFAPGQQYDHVGSPTDPYRFSPGHLLKGGVIGPDN
jgi:hypothetical protein